MESMEVSLAPDATLPGVPSGGKAVWPVIVVTAIVAGVIFYATNHERIDGWLNGKDNFPFSVKI